MARPSILNESGLSYPTAPRLPVGLVPLAAPATPMGVTPAEPALPFPGVVFPVPVPSTSSFFSLAPLITHFTSHSLANGKPAEPVLYQIPPPSSPLPSRAQSVEPVPSPALPLPAAPTLPRPPCPSSLGRGTQCLFPPLHPLWGGAQNSFPPQLCPCLLLFHCLLLALGPPLLRPSLPQYWGTPKFPHSCKQQRLLLEPGVTLIPMIPKPNK